MRREKTFVATVYVGRKVRETGEILPEEICHAVLQDYVDTVGLCVTCTPTTYIYKNGNEPGFAVGLIQYPRFPTDEALIRIHAKTIAEKLMTVYRQLKVSIVFPDTTITIGEEAQG